MSAVILAVELVRGLALPGALDAWAGLEAQVPDAPVACGHRWTRAFLAHFGDVVAPSIALVRDDGELVGVALVCRDVVRRGPLRVRRLHVGTAGEPPDASIWVERNGLLTLPGRRPEVARALVDALRAERDWDALELPGFLPSHLQAFTDAGLVVNTEVVACAVTELDGPDDPLERLSAKTRARARRSDRLVGPCTARFASDPDEAVALLDDLVTLHQEMWVARGRPGAFADPRVRAFHADVLRALLPTGDAWIARIDGAAGRVACGYGFFEGDRMTGYQIARVPVEAKGASVGLIADIVLLRAARARGLRFYDLLAGDGRHKHQVSTTDAEVLVWAQARRGAARWAVHDAARELRRGVRRARGAAAGRAGRRARSAAGSPSRPAPPGAPRGSARR